MTRRRKFLWLLVFSAVAALVGIILHDRFVAGPVYHGAPLNLWLRMLNTADTQLDQQPREAIRALGPAALPLIIEWLDWRDSLLRRSLNAWVAGDPRHIDFQPLSSKDRRRIALEACDILGAKAQPAIPKLVSIATAHNPELDAPFLIARIGGPNAQPALAKISGSNNKFIRAGAQVSRELLTQSSPLLHSGTDSYRDQLQEYHLLVMRAVISTEAAKASSR